MSLYKTQRCRHFDEGGNPIKPYCSQGHKCRFIHPGDHQWNKFKRRNDDTPSPQNRDSARSKGKNKPLLSPARAPPRQHVSPSIPQAELPKRKQRDLPRERDNRDWIPRRASDSWGVPRDGPPEQEYSLKRASNEVHSYPSQRPRLSDATLPSGGGSNNAHHAVQADKVSGTAPHVLECDSKTKLNVSDTFHRLAKLCCEIVQDTCFLDREQDKLKAFTGLSSELSRAVPDAAVTVAPAFATVINASHTQTRDRLERNVGEFEGLWKTLFSSLESDITKIIDSRLEQAMTLLDKGRDSALRAISHSQRLVSERVYNGTVGPHQWTDDWRETGVDKNAVSSQGSLTNGGAMINTPAEETHPAPLPLTPIHGADLGTSIKTVLEDMKMQMDRQTRAIELLAKENIQLRSVSERIHPQLVPAESNSSSAKKPSVV